MRAGAEFVLHSVEMCIRDRSFSVSAKAVTKPFNEEPVEFRVGLMMLGSLAVAATNGEIFHAIGRRIKEESPYRDTMVITHAGQWTAYVKDDSGEGEYETCLLYTSICADDLNQILEPISAHTQPHFLKGLEIFCSSLGEFGTALGCVSYVRDHVIDLWEA